MSKSNVFFHGEGRGRGVEELHGNIYPIELKFSELNFPSSGIVVRPTLSKIQEKFSSSVNGWHPMKSYLRVYQLPDN